MERDETGSSIEPGTYLRVVRDEDVVEVVDDALDTWVVRFEPLNTDPTSDAKSLAAAEGIAVGLVAALPGLGKALNERGALKVAFSPEIRKALANGSMHLMKDGALPVAVDGSGKIVEIATVAGATTAAAGAGLGLGSAVIAAWPLVLAAGVATAAAAAHQRWLEHAFAGLGAQLDKIETRMRDDDFGVLDAADSLVDLVGRLGAPSLPDQLRHEVANARLSVESIYFSRRRFVERLKHAIEEQQNQHEAKTGERTAWAEGVAKHLGKDGSAIDELVVFTRALATRARLGSVTASLLLNAGAPVASIALLDQLDGSLRHDYWDLQNRMSALARSSLNEPIWRRLTDKGDGSNVHRDVVALSRALGETVGKRMSQHDEPLVLELPDNWRSA